MAEKKRSAAKTVGIVFFILTVVVCVALAAYNIYIGGQMKTIDQVYSAVTHDTYNDYVKCFAEGSERLYEKSFNELVESYRKDWGEEFRLSADFISRERFSDGSFKVNVRVTVYNKTDSEKSQSSFIMSRKNGKWVINE